MLKQTMAGQKYGCAPGTVHVHVLLVTKVNSAKAPTIGGDFNLWHVDIASYKECDESSA